MREYKSILHSPGTITSGTGLFKAVCHKCHYVGFEPNHSRCVHCGFPLILEPYESAQVALRELFDRSSVELGLHVKAPPLPGVDPQKRKAQLLAEARRSLRAQSSASRPDTARPATVMPARPETHQPVVRPETHQPVARPETHHPVAHHAVAARPVTHEPAFALATIQPLPHGHERFATYQTRPAHGSGRARVGMVLAFVSAVLAGVALAVMTSGL